MVSYSRKMEMILKESREIDIWENTIIIPESEALRNP